MEKLWVDPMSAVVEQEDASEITENDANLGQREDMGCYFLISKDQIKNFQYRFLDLLVVYPVNRTSTLFCLDMEDSTLVKCPAHAAIRTQTENCQLASCASNVKHLVQPHFPATFSSQL